MVQSDTSFESLHYDRARSMVTDDILIEELCDTDGETVAELIRRNLAEYEEAGNVLAATWRRLENIYDHYSPEGRRFFVARDMAKDVLIGAAGLGSLHGLPLSEGMGEIRDLVVESNYRGRGVGKRLLRRSVEMAREFGYTRLYLETTPQMENAKKLFVRFGFRAVEHAKGEKSNAEGPRALPSYFVLEDLVNES
jgi:putative acetyltransferase